VSKPFNVGDTVDLKVQPKDWDRLKTFGLRGTLRITVGGVSVLLTTPVKLLQKPSVRLRVKTVTAVN
jgi:hypothetical protein